MEKHLHIISLTVPYPVNYGGVVDVFYKLIALHDLGIKIHLHCFNYGREEQPVLEKYCASVHYYNRKTGHKAISRKLPYIVASRKNEVLMQRLLEDDYPILMEGVHCSYLVFDKRFENRKCFVRLHNVEYKYYYDLFKSSRSPIRKLYYWNESRLLYKYESALAKKAVFWGVTEIDSEVYRKEFGCANIDFLPLYLPPWVNESKLGMGSYCLYHGDLSIDANDKAAKWLLKEVFFKLKLPLVIAGKNPAEDLVELSHLYSHTCIVENPSEKEMQDMIAKAHIHVLPSFTKTGIKIKVLNALTNGKHCVVNDATIDGTGLNDVCHVANTTAEFQKVISDLFDRPFSAPEREKRQDLINQLFNNRRNAEKQVEWIWG